MRKPSVFEPGMRVAWDGGPAWAELSPTDCGYVVRTDLGGNVLVRNKRGVERWVAPGLVFVMRNADGSLPPKNPFLT